MAYIKIVLALLVWGLLFFYGGSIWLDDKREQACTSEIEKNEPDLKVVKERCLQTAEVYMGSEDYGSASWFYLLGGDVDKNLNEVEAKITDDFYMNIGHSYLLKGDYEKAKEIYAKYPWEGEVDFHYVDELIQPDFIILPKLYKDKKENLVKGLAIWNEIYEPIAKIVKASNAYNMVKDDENSTEQIHYLEEYLEYALPFKDKASIGYLAKKEELAELYSSDEQELKSIEIYKELTTVYESKYETNSSTKYEYIYMYMLVTIARKYNNLSEYNLSLLYYEKVLSLSLDSNMTELPLRINNIYSNIADIYSKTNKEKQALDYHAKAIGYLLENDTENYGRLSKEYLSISTIYYGQKEYNLSIENCNKSIELKKEELKDSSDYYSDYLFYNLEDLYAHLADNYTALKMNEKAKETNGAYIAFMEYEYETHYKHIAMAYVKSAKRDINSSVGLESQLKAIKYMKKSVETELDYQKEENNEALFNCIFDLKKYIDVLDKNRTNATKSYIEHLESFIEFEEETFLGEESNAEILEKSYKLLADRYKSIDDDVNFLKYEEKLLKFTDELNETKEVDEHL